MSIEFKIRNLTVIDLNCLFDSALFEANKYALDNDIKNSKDISTLFKHFTFTKFLDVCQNFTTKNILLYFEDQSDLPKDYFLILKLLKNKIKFPTIISNISINEYLAIISDDSPEFDEVMAENYNFSFIDHFTDFKNYLKKSGLLFLNKKYQNLTEVIGLLISCK
jgi:hypothetical protein